jgi:tetratricopeptide (TPR) repeat protein
MSLFQEASQLNNQGVVALIQGDDDFAIESMTKAIKLMKKELAKPATALTDFTSSEDGPELRTVEIPDMESSDENYEVFNQAIHVPCNSRDESDLDIHVYSAAVIFNLALAHHRKGMNGNEVYRVKALRLYSMVLQIIDDSLISFQTAATVKLATINNLAQIQVSRGNYEDAEEVLKHLYGVLHAATESVLASPQVQGLLMNVLMFRAPSVAAAA